MHGPAASGSVSPRPAVVGAGSVSGTMRIDWTRSRHCRCHATLRAAGCPCGADCCGGRHQRGGYVGGTGRGRRGGGDGLHRDRQPRWPGLHDGRVVLHRGRTHQRHELHVRGAGEQRGRVPLSWAAPASDGGSSITGYQVTVTPGSVVSTTGTGVTVGGLTNGTAYSFTVAAVNARGVGPAAGPVTATPVAPRPPSSRSRT